ncbi:MAG: type II toxin-antitoxin system HicA family toxin [Microbacteriaceae bacterium]|nr:type II toxin-antitoxin system HicA family toxin [Microbacteriaceae bacterium]
MKRRDFVRHMVEHGCELVREGQNHSWWGNPTLNHRSAVPRHREIPDNFVRKICRDPGIPAPGEADEKGKPRGAADSR